MYITKSTSAIKHIDFILVDLLSLLLSFLIAYSIRFPNSDFTQSNENYLTVLIYLSLILVLVSLLIGNYHDIIRRGYLSEFINVSVLALCLAGVTALVLFLLKVSSQYSRLLFGYTIVLFVLIDFILRNIYKLILKKIKTLSKRDRKKVFLVCEKKELDDALKTINGDVFNSYIVDAFSLVDAYRLPIDREKNVQLDCAADYICKQWIDEVIIYKLFHNNNNNKLGEFISHCQEMGVTVHRVLPNDADYNKYSVGIINGETVLTTAYNYMAPYQYITKRIFDIFASIIGCIIATIIMIVIGPIIYFKDPGPILFRQERVGKNGKIFKILKLRSMYLNADEMKKQYMEKNRVSDGMMFKLDDDPRILPGIGNFIRKTSLDEFPQFFNVLIGDMSLVGTRPPTLDEWEKYRYHHRARLSILPGITGMWQVSGRSQITDFDEVVKLDTYYITHYRLALDIKIIFKTFFVLFNKRGAM